MNEATGTAAPQQPSFSIEKLFVKDISLEIPHAPTVFLEREAPQIALNLHTEAGNIDAGLYEASVTATVTAKLAEKDKVMFLIEVTQAGVFQLLNLPPAEVDTVLNVVCPNILYPYLREVVSDVSVRAGFAPVLLNPVNFEALHMQHKQQQAEAASAATH